jgi:hypothetical protein
VFALFYALIANIEDLGQEVAAVREQQAVSWYRQMVFEGRVRGLENAAAVVVGHPYPAEGDYITINDITEDSAIGPYGANTYTNVAVGQPLEVILRRADGTAVESLIVEGLEPGDLVIAWVGGDDPEATSPDLWSLPAHYRTGLGLTVAIEHFTGEIE